MGANATVQIRAQTPVAVSYRLLQRNKDGHKGCNASASAPVVLTISAPDAVTVLPADKQLTFKNCRTPQSAVFSLNAQGGPYLVTVTATGPGSFDTAPASFVLVVLPPADEEAPLVTVHFPPPNASGWYLTKPVVGTVTAADPSNVSAIECVGAVVTNTVGISSTVASADLVVSTEGPAYVSCQATDGSTSAHTGVKSGSVYAANVEIDTLPPAVTPTLDRAPDSNGWYNHGVTVSFLGEDESSGIDVCSDPVLFSGPDQASATLWGACSDLAGNQALQQAATFDYDDTAPIHVAGAADRPADFYGGYRRSVTINFAGADAVSGAAPGSLSCTTVTYTGPASPRVTVPGSCTDPAGNTSAPAGYVFKFFGMQLLPVIRR